MYWIKHSFHNQGYTVNLPVLTFKNDINAACVFYILHQHLDLPAFTKSITLMQHVFLLQYIALHYNLPAFTFLIVLMQQYITSTFELTCIYIFNYLFCRNAAI